MGEVVAEFSAFGLDEALGGVDVHFFHALSGDVIFEEFELVLPA